MEIWLGDLLRVSRKSVHSVIRSASIAIGEQSFKLLDFEYNYPAQIGLLGIQMIWTRDAEEALAQAKADKKIMQTTNQHFLDILNELIQVTTQDLTKIERTKFETLITIHVHQKDIFDDLVSVFGILCSFVDQTRILKCSLFSVGCTFGHHRISSG